VEGLYEETTFGPAFVTSVYWGQLDLECVAAAPAPTTAASVVAPQNHNASDLPADLASIGAFSTVLVAITSAAPLDPAAATALLFDANGSGNPDAGDQFLFGPQPVVDGTVVNPIDRGGGYFVAVLGDDQQIDDLVGSAIQVVEVGESPGQFTIDGTQIDIVVNSVEDPRPVFYDVDFGDPTMPPQVA
jgi:hypothetical protein